MNDDKITFDADEFTVDDFLKLRLYRYLHHETGTIFVEINMAHISVGVENYPCELLEYAISTVRNLKKHVCWLITSEILYRHMGNVHLFAKELFWKFISNGDSMRIMWHYSMTINAYEQLLQRLLGIQLNEITFMSTVLPDKENEKGKVIEIYETIKEVTRAKVFIGNSREITEI